MQRRPLRGQTDENRRHKPDYLLLVISGMLVGLGLLLMVAISPALTAQGNVPGSYYIIRQLTAALIGFVLFFFFSRANERVLRAISIPFVVASVISAALVLIISGIAFRWIQIGGLSFQPAELIKFTIVIVGGLFIADRVKDGTYTNDRKTLLPIGIAMAAVAFVVVILERDLGSMVVMAAIMFTMMIVANIPLKRLLLIGAALIAVGGLAIAATPYRRDRFATFLNPTSDCSEEGYHACQALIAVGSGGLAGLGLGNSVQAYGYLPEASNDSIFAIYAEKFGFIGSLLLILLYGLLLFRILRTVQRSPSMVMRLISAGVFGWIATQTIINIGAMIGLLPLKGITLPFISYGGTSIMFVLAALGLVFRASQYTVLRKSLHFGEGGEAYGQTENDSSVGRRYSRSHHAHATRR